jgi:hypothetical protein
MALDPPERLETDALPDELHQSVSTTSGSITQDGGIAIRAAERQPCPEGSVPLHQLCDNCFRFFESWKYLDWFQKTRQSWGGDIIPSALSGDHVLCTVARLLQTQEDCHFCKMVVSLLPNAESCHPVESVGLHLNKYLDDLAKICCGGKTNSEVELSVESFEGKS